MTSCILMETKVLAAILQFSIDLTTSKGGKWPLLVFWKQIAIYFMGSSKQINLKFDFRTVVQYQVNFSNERNKLTFISYVNAFLNRYLKYKFLIACTPFRKREIVLTDLKFRALNFELRDIKSTERVNIKINHSKQAHKM